MKPILQCFSIIFIKNKDSHHCNAKNVILVMIMTKKIHITLMTLKISFSLL